jgi:hypothetical protein
MKKLFIFLIGLMIMFSLNSCDTYNYATTQDDIYVETEVDVVRSNVSFDVIIQYGTPYYRDNVLLYYLYRDIYYYPFYYNNYWYVRAYRRPFTHFDTRPYFRPHKYDYRFSPGHYKGFGRPDRHEYYYRHHRNMRRPDNHARPPRRDVRNHPQRPPQAHPNVRPTQPRIDRNQNNHHNGTRMGGRR